MGISVTMAPIQIRIYVYVVYVGSGISSYCNALPFRK